MNKINKIKLSGTTYDIQDKNATNVINVSQAEYDALVQAGTVDPTA
jgi:predicted transcriptional regulator